MNLSDVKPLTKLKIRLKKLFFIKLTPWENIVYKMMTQPLFAAVMGNSLLTEAQYERNDKLFEEERKREKDESLKRNQVRFLKDYDWLIGRDGLSPAESQALSVSSSGPLHTFHSIGPWVLTYKYPVCSNSIKKEILREDGRIGPEKYKKFPGALEALTKYDNYYFIKNEEAAQTLLRDLNVMWHEYGYFDVLTIAASFAPTCDLYHELMGIAADNGVREGMVSYGIDLFRDHKVAEGISWVRKGAERGCLIGMLIMGVSQQFGTLTKIDYNEAAKWYRRIFHSDDEDSTDSMWKSFAATNLGVLYADAGFFHTAMKYFVMAKKLMDEQPDMVRELELELARTNYIACGAVLKYPFSERRKHAVIQAQAPELDHIFCLSPEGKQVAPPPVFNPAIDKVVPFTPDDDELDAQDRDERYRLENNGKPKDESVRFPLDSFVFPRYEVEIRSSIVRDNQQELIFLERNVHTELNAYIQSHFADIKDLFKKNGFYLVYLPAHAYDFRDETDIMVSYLTADKTRLGEFSEKQEWEKRRSENQYWDAFFSEEDLPDDCAGFLQYVSDDDGADRLHYQYIIFPHRPGTDWGRAFNAFIACLTGKPADEVTDKRLLDVETKIVVDRKFQISVTDGRGAVVGQVKMPTLSKVLYFVYLKHPEGVSIKELSDYRDELLELYRQVSYKQINEKSIDDLVDPTKNSANEKISRIRKAFEDALGNYQCDISSMVPTGKKGERYVVAFDRSLVVWEPTSVTLS